MVSDLRLIMLSGAAAVAVLFGAWAVLLRPGDVPAAATTEAQGLITDGGVPTNVTAESELQEAVPPPEPVAADCEVTISAAATQDDADSTANHQAPKFEPPKSDWQSRPPPTPPAGHPIRFSLLTQDGEPIADYILQLARVIQDNSPRSTAQHPVVSQATSGRDGTTTTSHLNLGTYQATALIPNQGKLELVDRIFNIRDADKHATRELRITPHHTVSGTIRGLSNVAADSVQVVMVPKSSFDERELYGLSALGQRSRLSLPHLPDGVLRASFEARDLAPTLRFNFEYVPKRPYVVYAIARVDGQWVTSHSQTITANSSVSELELWLPWSTIVGGRLLDPMGKPIADVEIGAIPEGGTGAPHGGTIYRAKTDADGFYRIRGIPVGNWSIVVLWGHPESQTNRELMNRSLLDGTDTKSVKVSGVSQFFIDIELGRPISVD